VSKAALTPADVEFLVALRRDLHQHPELSWQEGRTQERLERALRESGVSDVRRVARTGLVARIPGTTPGAPCVALRGDIDALPITEATGLACASVNDGVMHACGHDMHAAWTVGAARLLARTPAGGDVLVVLQPAEEVGEGARAILESGALDGARMIFGAHVDPRFDVGQVVAQPGPLAASADTFRVRLTGRGGHGARPHRAIDPIVGAAALISSLQTLVSRSLDPGLPGVVTVGAVHAGNAPNVIPEVAELLGTIRATTVASRTVLHEGVRRVAQGVAAAHGLTVEIVVTPGTPPLVNSPDAAAIAARAAAKVVGEPNVVPLGSTNMAGEDFACYLERMSGCFIRIGVRGPGGDVTDVHTPRFAPDEGALAVGSRLLAECALLFAHS